MIKPNLGSGIAPTFINQGITDKTARLLDSSTVTTSVRVTTVKPRQDEGKRYIEPVTAFSTTEKIDLVDKSSRFSNR
jgi:hypothetical protein